MSALPSQAHEQRQQWLQSRRRGLGASDAPIVLGLTGSRLNLYFDKLGELDERPRSEAMDWGLRLEDDIIEAFEERTGEKIVAVQAQVEHPTMPWMLATLDGVTDTGEIVELKAIGGSGEARELGFDGESNTLPNAWVVQAHQQMIVAGKEAMRFAVFGPSLKLRIFPLELSDVLAEMVVEEDYEFWHNHVLRRVPPPEIHAEDADTLVRIYRAANGQWLDLRQDRELSRLAAQYNHLGGKIKDLEGERAVAKARLLLALGDAAGAELMGGLRATRNVVTVNHKAKEAYTNSYVRMTIHEPK